VFTRLTLRERRRNAETHGMGISSVCSSACSNLPETVRSPADAAAVLAAKKALDAQKSEAAGLVALLDPNAGKLLNASA
jgi:hypothetical protein